MSDRAPLSADEIRELGRRYGSWTAAAKATGRSVSQIKTRASSFGIKIADVANSEAASSANVTSDDPAEWGDIRELLKRRNLNPDDFLITRVRVNEWADERQLRVDLEPVASVVMPARADGWKAPKPRKRASKNGELVAFLSDQHAPYHDRDLHELVCQWLRDEKPDRIYCLGDLLDFASVSRWQPNPENVSPDGGTGSVQECIDAGYEILRAYREAAPDAEIFYMAGNHEDRLRDAIFRQGFGAIYGLHRAGDEQSVLSPAFLLRLDELRVEYVRSEAGGYQHAAARVSSELQAIHGWIARKGSASSAAATLDHMRVSTIQGHTHRNGLHYKTEWTIDNEPRTLVAAETGTLAMIRNGLTHAARPDWQQGFCTAQVWDDLFSLDLAVYVKDSEQDGALLWRGKRWS